MQLDVDERPNERAPSSSPGAEYLRMNGIQKHFGGAYALRGANLSIRTHEVHGLIGQNGSGKSTLLSILSGQIRPDGGEILIQGEAVELLRPDIALNHGIAMVTQELTLAPDLTVGENIFLGHSKPRGLFGIRWEALHRKATALLDQLELDVSSRTPVSDLRLDQQQLVEVARAISSAAQVVILDEPTSALADSAVERLMEMVRRLRENGTGVVFVSHRMDELFEISDHITVLRDGNTVGSRPVGEYTRDSLVADMLGRTPEKFTPAPAQAGTEGVLLSVTGLHVDRAVENLDFEVGQGEVVGLVGLTGSGRTEVLQALFGQLNEALGTIDFGHGPESLPKTPVHAMDRGLGYVPGDRKSEGLILELSVRNNIALSRSALGGRLRPIRFSRERAETDAAVKAMRIVTSSIEAPVSSLSGGNQQKVLLSKWIATKPKLLMLDEPTRGVDVAAKAEIHELLRTARNNGLAILVSSSEIEELMVLCDRLIVLFRGKLVANIPRAGATEAGLAHLLSGGMTNG